MLIRKPLLSIGDRLQQTGVSAPVSMQCDLCFLAWFSVRTALRFPMAGDLRCEPFGLRQQRGRPLAVLPMFFALSGFLVVGSAIRLSALTPFLLSRGLRIIPALATEITISALLIGSALTSLPLREYFTSRGLLEYFGSLTGRVVFELPGVIFIGNPNSVQVNERSLDHPTGIVVLRFHVNDDRDRFL